MLDALNNEDSNLRKWTILVAVCIGVFSVTFNTTAIMNALPGIMKSLNLSSSAAEWAINAYMLGAASLIAIGGRMGDIFPRRWVYYFGGAGFMLGSAIVALAGDTVWLIIGRACQGIFVGFVVPTSLTIIKVNFPHPDRQKVAIGAWAAIASLGFASGPLVSGVLIQLVNWRVIFWVNLPIIILSFLILFFVKAKPSQNDTRLRIDYSGLILLILSVFCLSLGLTEGSHWGWSNFWTWACIIGGIIFFIILYFIDRNKENAVMHFGAFKNFNFNVSMILLFFTFYAMISFLYIYNLYIQNDAILDLSALYAGLSLLPTNIALFILSFTVPKICIRFGFRFPSTISFLCLTVGFLWFYFIGSHSTYAALWFPLLLIGIGLGGTFPTFPGHALSKLPEKLAGGASGMVSLNMYFTSVFATAISAIFYHMTSYDTLANGLKKIGQLPPETIQYVSSNITANLLPLKQILTHLPVGLHSQVTLLAKNAGTYAFNNAMLVGAIVCCVGVLLSLFCLRDE